jgi:hypothetical protein
LYSQGVNAFFLLLSIILMAVGGAGAYLCFSCGGHSDLFAYEIQCGLLFVSALVILFVFFVSVCLFRH